MQYYGWSLVNRDQLMPKREQVLHAEKVTNEFRERIGNKMKIFFVVPDYYDDRPKKSKDRKNFSDSSFWVFHISLQYSSVDVLFSIAASSAGVPCSSVAQINTTS